MSLQHRNRDRLENRDRGKIQKIDKYKSQERKFSFKSNKNSEGKENLLVHDYSPLFFQGKRILLPMTPETIYEISQLRKNFYSLFKTVMAVPVNLIKDNSSASDRFLAFWLDNRLKLNYVMVYAHISPDQFMPERPLILRVALNIGANPTQTPKWGKTCQGLNKSWYFQLTLLPEEILDFPDWIVSIIESRGQSFSSFVKTSPYPLDWQTSTGQGFDVWTQQAYSKLLEQN